MNVLAFLSLLNTISLSSSKIAELALTIKRIDGTETTIQLSQDAKATFQETIDEADAFLNAPEPPEEE